jgi:deazaflavin-dependent oxidoreductase (nitroreductase family)
VALPRWLARFNVAFTNRFMLPIAGVLPWFGIVEHVGRRSGRQYRTPVNVFRRADRYVFALTYGPESEWVRNVMAAGRCTLVSRGRRFELVDPRRFRDARRREMPWVVRIGLGVLNVTEFLELHRAVPSEASPGTCVGRQSARA